MNKPRSLSHPKTSIELGFDTKMIDVPLHQIIPLKLMTGIIRTSTKYMQIVASVKEVGVIEPPVVSRDTKIKNRFILLDGHLRVEALKELGKEEVTCLLSTDDESFTYNKHISRLSTIQEHRMIVKAVERGVSESKIAKALSLDVSSIVRKRNLLEGICDEAADLLKDKVVSSGVFPILRRMKPFRQIEMAGLMNDSGIYGISYAEALLAATPKNQLVESNKPKKVKGLNEEQMARMENEMANLQREYRLIEENYGTDVLNLTIAKTYLSNLLGNARVVRYLAQHHPEIPMRMKRRGVEMRLVIDNDDTPAANPDPILLKTIARAHVWAQELLSGKTPSMAGIASRNKVSVSYVKKLMPLAFLSPDIVETAIAGRQPADLTTQKLIRQMDIPLDWKAQKRVLGF